MSLLATRGLTRRFGGLCALDSVDLALGTGEILGVIGPNGAGKTTLFSLIAGSIRPTAGEIFLDGRPVTQLPAHRRVRAGIVRTHQVVRPFANLTIFENVLVAAMHAHRRAHGTTREQVADVLELVGLADRYDQLPGSLTLAGRKRLELARALSTGPRVLLLDEVVAGVNPAEAIAFAALIRRIRDERGISIVITEHVMPAVMSLSDRIIVLEYGKRIAEGTPREIVADPRVIAAYLGSEAGHDSAEKGSAKTDSTENAEKGGAEKEGAEKEGAEKEGAEKEGAEKEGAEKGGAEKEGAEKEGAEKGGAEKERAEKEGAEKEGAEKEGAENHRVENDRSEHDSAEKEDGS